MNQDPANEQTENHYKGLQAKVADAVRLETLLTQTLFLNIMLMLPLDYGPQNVSVDDLHHLVFLRLCPTGK